MKNLWKDDERREFEGEILGIDEKWSDNYKKVIFYILTTDEGKNKLEISTIETDSEFYQSNQNNLKKILSSDLDAMINKRFKFVVYDDNLMLNYLLSLEEINL